MVTRRRLRSPLPTKFLPSHVFCKIAFVWARLNSPHSKPICLNIVREVCSYLSYLPVPTGVFYKPSRLCVFSFATKIWTEQSLSAYANQWRRFNPCSASIGEGQVVICGGITQIGKHQSVVKEALLVDREKFIELPAMHEARFLFGILYVDEQLAVYVFGGGVCTPPRLYLGDVEKLNLRSLKWESCGKMTTSRCAVALCRHDQLVYICSYGNPTCETMSLSTGVFTLIPDISIQAALGPIIYFTAIYKDQLIIVCPNGRQMFDLKTRKSAVVRITKEVYQYVRVSLVLEGERFVYSYFRGEPRGARFDLETGEQILYCWGLAYQRG